MRLRSVCVTALSSVADLEFADPGRTINCLPSSKLLEIGDGYELGVTTGCIFIVMLNFIVAKLRSLHKYR